MLSSDGQPFTVGPIFRYPYGPVNITREPAGNAVPPPPTPLSASTASVASRLARCNI
jgi:hypothetical protein